MAARRTLVLIEAGTKRTFASALDWPGWSRSGKTEALALEALEAYRDRYGHVLEAAGVAGPSGALEVVEHAIGGAGTEFGVPEVVAEADHRPLPRREAARLAEIVQAAWAALGEVARTAPESLRKGPRGGGRDRDAVVAHVVEAERAYARRIGVTLAKGSDDVVGGANRNAIVRALREGAPDAGVDGWPARYAARRIAWHALDHAWEIEDRSTP